jgi:hypothetical protein
MPNKLFNKSILRLWSETFYNEEGILAPLVYPVLNTNQLLFIGINPSFSEKGLLRCLKDSKYADLNLTDFYRWNNENEFDLNTAIAIEMLTKTNYPYFRKFQDISEYCGLKWDHIDLFFFRETNQVRAKSIIFKNKSEKEFTKFAEQQLALSKQLIENINPKIIVVANALASRIFKNYFECKFDDSLGFHRAKINNKEIPVFLASMLTGQRAMDNFSYQRLKWHINQVK